MHYAAQNRYGNSKTLRRVLRSACFFSRKKRQENGTDCKNNYGGSKVLRMQAPCYFEYGRVLWVPRRRISREVQTVN